MTEAEKLDKDYDAPNFGINRHKRLKRRRQRKKNP